MLGCEGVQRERIACPEMWPRIRGVPIVCARSCACGAYLCAEHGAEIAGGSLSAALEKQNSCHSTPVPPFRL